MRYVDILKDPYQFLPLLAFANMMRFLALDPELLIAAGTDNNLLSDIFQLLSLFSEIKIYGHVD